jgi:hypothetical protein
VDLNVRPIEIDAPTRITVNVNSIIISLEDIDKYLLEGLKLNVIYYRDMRYLELWTHKLSKYIYSVAIQYPDNPNVSVQPVLDEIKEMVLHLQMISNELLVMNMNRNVRPVGRMYLTPDYKYQITAYVRQNVDKRYTILEDNNNRTVDESASVCNVEFNVTTITILVEWYFGPEGKRELVFHTPEFFIETLRKVEVRHMFSWSELDEVVKKYESKRNGLMRNIHRGMKLYDFLRDTLNELHVALMKI